MTEKASRVDAIGQPISIGDIVMPFAKSSYIMPLSIVTKYNPKTIQLNGSGSVDDDRLVVVTQNLIADGRQQVVDQLRIQYDSKLDHKQKETKIPIRYIIVGNPRAAVPTAAVCRFEYHGIDSARAAHNAVSDRYTHIIGEGYSGTLKWQTRHWLKPANVFAWRSLPDSVASIANSSSTVIEIPSFAEFEDLGFDAR